MKQKILKGPGGLKLILDKDEIFPDDPGAGTPAIVECRECTATYNCAVGTGELLGNPRTHQLSQAQLEWLGKVEGKMEKFLFGDDDESTDVDVQSG